MSRLRANSCEHELKKEYLGAETALRPKTWKEYIGQDKIKKNIQVIIEAAKNRKETIDHLLFYGNSGLGKTTLSYLIAKEIKAKIRIISGPSIEKPGDLASILTSLEKGDILFIDECHRINKPCEEYLYSAIEDFKLNLILGKGLMARTMELKLAPFTLIGATTRLASLSPPLRNRFGAIFQLDFYNLKDIAKIIAKSAQVLQIQITPQAIKIIAKSSRFTPRAANRLLKRARDFAQVKGKGIIDEKIATLSLNSLEIDKLGLEPGDRKIL